jgi:transposase
VSFLEVLEWLSMKLLSFEKLKAVVTQLCHHFKLVKETSTTGRPRKISPLDAMTLSLYQHTSTRATKKSIYEDFKDILKCSYKTLVVAINTSAVYCLRLLFLIMRLGRKQQHLVKYTDATDIPVCLKKNADSHQTMAALAELGRSSKGWYFGLKLTITRDMEGRLLAILFTRPSANDRKICQRINKDIYGIIVLDAGYVSENLEKAMNIEHQRWLLIRPYRTMKKLMTKWQEDLYRGRFSVEFDFRSLKQFFGLITSLPRSINGYLANYIHALTAFVLR